MGKIAREETLQRVAASLEAIALNGSGSAADIQSWKAVQNLVRAGMGPKAFPVGTQFAVEKETSLTAALGAHTGITAVSVTEETFLAKEGIVGTGVHEFVFNGSAWIYESEPVILSEYGLSVTGTPAADDEIIVTEAYDTIIFDVVHHKTVSGSPRMVLAMHDTINNRELDAPEAFYYAKDAALQAGTYHFTLLAGWDTSYGGGKTLQFTLTQEVPKGGQIVFDWPWNAQIVGRSVRTYSSPGSSTALESAAMSEGSDGTDLGTVDGSTATMNHTHRARYGSNNYKESSLRAWINSSKAANAWYESSNVFDRLPSYAGTAGLLHGMDQDFLSVVQKSTVPCKTNNTYELSGWTLNTAYTVKDKFYLLSRDELGYGQENVAEGSVLDFYSGATNADRIKYDIAAKTAARAWWLRSPGPGIANDTRTVRTDGSLTDSYANLGFGAVAACEIG